MNLTKIGDNAFDGCSFSGELKLPESLLSIGNNAFNGNSRLSGILEFPDKIQTIGDYAFSGCSDLQGLVIPKMLKAFAKVPF